MDKHKPLKPMFCRIGTKKTLADRIISAMPDDITTYVEPFIGGGAIYWKKPPSPKEVINDLDKDLVEGYRLIKKISPDAEFRKDLNTVPKIQRFMNTPARTDADKLTQRIADTCNRFMGKPGDKIYTKANPYSKLKNIEAYHNRMRNTTVLNKSYEYTLNKYDSPKTFFYLDPPYTKSGTEGKIYKHDVEEFSYEELAERLSKLKGRWMLSMLDTAEIRKQFKGYWFKSIKLPGRAGPSDAAIGRKPRTEIIIANYEF